jgi:hypothetical protein
MNAIRRYSTSAPVKKIGALRGGLIGFLSGVSITSAVVYCYAIDEYHNSNNLILKDVLSLTKSIRVLEEHVKALEQRK